MPPQIFTAKDPWEDVPGIFSFSMQIKKFDRHSDKGERGWEEKSWHIVKIILDRTGKPLYIIFELID